MELINSDGLGSVMRWGHSSSDHHLNKQSGRLFGFAHGMGEVTSGSTLHIGGDCNCNACCISRQYGGQSLAFNLKEKTELKSMLKEHLERREDNVAELFGMIKGSVKVPAGLAGIERRLYEYGMACSPLIVGFMLFVMEQCIRKGHEKVYFFTREGEFFKQVYDALRDAQPLGKNFPSSEILEVSRLATFSPSLREFTPNELMRIWSLYSTQSVAALFKSMNIDQTRVSKYLSQYHIDPHEPIQYPWQDERIIALFNDSRLREFLGEEVGRSRFSLMSYLERKGLTERIEAAAVVDIGWRGTIQDNLAYLLPECQFDGYYMGLDKFLNTQPKNCAKTSFGPNLNLAEWDKLNDFFRSVAPVEMLCNSPFGSVIGYKENGSSTVAVRVVDEDENAIFENYVKYYQKGVIDSVASVGDAIRVHAISSKELCSLAVRIWMDIISKPEPDVVTAYFQLNHNEQFGLGRFADKRNPIPRGRWWGMLFSLKRVREFIAQLDATGWPEGYLARRNLLFIWSAIRFLRKLRGLFLKYV